MTPKDKYLKMLRQSTRTDEELETMDVLWEDFDKKTRAAMNLEAIKINMATKEFKKCSGCKKCLVPKGYICTQCGYEN